MTMLERLTDVIEEHDDLAHGSAALWLVQAILAKLREPSEAMLKPLDEYASDLHEGISAKAEDAWKAAIDAILDGKA